MAARKKTSKRLATIAGKYMSRDIYALLKYSQAEMLRDIRALAASVLSQVEHEQKTKKVKK